MIWWTHEMDDRLRADFARIGSLRGVARDWGFTAGQIIGRAQRIGVTGYVRKDVPYVPVTERKKRPATGRLEAPAAKATPTRREEITKAPTSDVVALLDVRDGECRWLVERGFFCGAPTVEPSSSWCAYHKRLVFVLASKRRVARYSAGAVSNGSALL